MCPGAAEPGLHFVRDANAAGRAHMGVGVLQVFVRENHAAADALDRLGDEGGDLTGRRVLDQVLDIGGVFLPASGSS